MAKNGVPACSVFTDTEHRAAASRAGSSHGKSGKNSCGATTSWSYDAAGNRTQLVDAQGTTDYLYDNDGDNRLRSMTRGGQTIGTFEYDANGSMTRRIEGATTTTMTYDADGVKLHETGRTYTDPDTSATVTARTTFEYDASQPGLVSYVTPPRGNTGGSPDRT